MGVKGQGQALPVHFSDIFWRLCTYYEHARICQTKMDGSTGICCSYEYCTVGLCGASCYGTGDADAKTYSDADADRYFYPDADANSDANLSADCFIITDIGGCG